VAARGLAAGRGHLLQALFQVLGGLVQGSDGQLYGTTVFGGTNLAGAVFRITTNGTAYAILRRLGGAANSPTNPYCRLTEGAAGAFYGTTAYGGVPMWNMTVALRW